LLEKGSDGFGTWQITFDRDEFPGLYLARVTPATQTVAFSGEFEVTETIRDLDLTALDTGDAVIPDLDPAAEGAFSRFEPVTIRFRETLSPVGALTVGSSEADYFVTVLAMPSIAEAQEYASRRGVRNVAGDVLVKAPVPCFLRLSF